MSASTPIATVCRQICDPSLRANSRLMHCSKPLGLHDRWRPKETIGIADAYPEAIGFGHQEAA